MIPLERFMNHIMAENPSFVISYRVNKAQDSSLKMYKLLTYTKNSCKNVHIPTKC